MRARVGHAVGTGLYWERLGEARDQRPALLFIHGGGATGACWRAAPDGRAGWADLLAARGHECWVTDWPGTGRSGGRNGLEIEFSDVVAGYGELLRETISRPTLIVCHSMGAAITWKLLEMQPHLVVGVLSVAGAYPANLAPASVVLRDDGEVVDVTFADTGVTMSVDRRVMNLYGDAYLERQAIATSTRFDRELMPALRASLVGLPPRMFLQRLGVLQGMPNIDRADPFVDKPVRLLAGGEDPAHTRAIEQRTVEQLREWGAWAELVWLPDRGIEGNGHFMFAETNSDEILEIAAEQIDWLEGVAR